jgi:hypothetical protein
MNFLFEIISGQAIHGEYFFRIRCILWNLLIQMARGYHTKKTTGPLGSNTGSMKLGKVMKDLFSQISNLTGAFYVGRMGCWGLLG